MTYLFEYSNFINFNFDSNFTINFIEFIITIIYLKLHYFVIIMIVFVAKPPKVIFTINIITNVTTTINKLFINNFMQDLNLHLNY